MKHHPTSRATRSREIIFQTRNTSLFKTFDYALARERVFVGAIAWQITFHWKIQKINDRVAAKVTPVFQARKIVLNFN